MKSLISLLCAFPLLLFGQNPQKLLTLEDIFLSSKFKGNPTSGINWLVQGDRFSYQQYDSTTKSENIYIFDVFKGSRTLLVDVSRLKSSPNDSQFRYSSYQWSPQEVIILLESAPPDKQYLSRKTPSGNYFLYTLRDKSFKQITNVNEPQYNQKFSPDGTLLGFVRGNNIFVRNLETGTEIQCTMDGAEHIINGKFDWVYEEEFGISDGWVWSPDGKYIAFWHLDENRVPEFKMLNFMTPECEVIPMKYPTPGDSNSLVKIGVVSMDTKEVTWMDLGQEDDIYIPRIQWMPDGNNLLIQRLNRSQKKLEFLSSHIKTGKTRTILVEEEKTWIEETFDVLVLAKSRQFLRISEQDGNAHIYRYNLTGRLVNQVTRGKWDVSNIVAVDEDMGLLYFTAGIQTLAEKQLFSVKIDGSNLRQLTPDGFTHTITPSPGAKWFIDKYSNRGTPTKIALIDQNGKVRWMINEDPIASLKEYNLSKTEFFSFKTSDGIELNGSMMKPPDLDVHKKYPVLIDAYGGPGSQAVTNSWGGTTALWHQMMVQKGYIIVSVDGRGTCGRGKEFKSIVYHQLGTWEVHDQVEAVKYLVTLPFIDASRIGIWGWSYGGYMAVSAILRGADYFRTAVAVAPVTDWRLYDDIYTERFMGLPKDNLLGYKNSSTLTYVEKLKGNLLIIHGTSDDNVHWQNTVRLVDALEKAGKQFQTMFYPNKNHSIRGDTTRYHLFETMTNYLLEKL